MRHTLFQPTWRALALAAVLSAAAGASGTEAAPGSAQRILAGQLRLARGLLEALAREHPGENVVVSPASAAGMLAAVDLGAGRAMHADILGVLGIASGPAAEDDLAALREAAARTRADGDLSTATRVVFDRALHPAAAGLDRLRIAGIEGEVEDLHAPSADADINAWAARATRGKIDRIVDEIAPDAGMIALNALYLSGSWLHPFDASETRPGDFNTVSGQRVRTAFMHGEPTSFAVRQDDRFIAVDLPFAGARFEMVALAARGKPSQASEFADHFAWLDGRGFAPANGVAIDLPRFHERAKRSLLPALVAVGLDQRQPFTRFAGADLFVSDIVQAIDVVFDEKGAEVTAATAGGFNIVSKFTPGRNIEVVFDKPFAYAVRDRQTGLMLAVGYVSTVDGTPVAATEAPLAAGSSLIGDAELQRATDMTRMQPAKPVAPEGRQEGRQRPDRGF